MMICDNNNILKTPVSCFIHHFKQKRFFQKAHNTSWDRMGWRIHRTHPSIRGKRRTYLWAKIRGGFEFGQLWVHRCNVITLQIWPLKVEAPEFAHSQCFKPTEVFLTTADRLGTNLTEFWMSSSVTSTTEQCSSSKGRGSVPPFVTHWSTWNETVYITSCTTNTGDGILLQVCHWNNKENVLKTIWRVTKCKYVFLETYFM